MILFELLGTEQHPTYQELQVENLSRQYEFLKSMVKVSLATGRPLLSHTLIKALNYHVIACMHVHAGEYRPCAVKVGPHNPPEHYRVAALMDDFINEVNRHWDKMDPVVLAAFVLWRLNYIHPFINGNGRTARAACHFVLCAGAGGWLAGEKILPQLLDRDHDEYVEAIRAADASLMTVNGLNLQPLHSLISRLLAEQVGLVP